MQDKDLDGLLSMAASRAPRPSDGLMDRVLADAMALQPRPEGIAAPAAPAPVGLLARLAALFGGAPVVAGVLSAAMAGVAVGYFSPATTDLLTGGLGAGAEVLDLFPSADFLMTEG
ncbi:dihydroorotate dehydrogenase [Tabrizicola sp.]|uniref:dihydroorotate dehydrogenase n=1 Tax=Tabrizicola sp. TaxID=2005166 RepID=UPI0026078457|nr:dihydroorotate dehydrogenase [Tabrizicola sp.]MDM7933395.1 dihydroorotate dehydrogenase [Tabrizicola sp.]